MFGQSQRCSTLNTLFMKIHSIDQIEMWELCLVSNFLALLPDLMSYNPPALAGVVSTSRCDL